MVQNDTYVVGFDDVHDAPGFWIREWELAAEKDGVNFRGVPQAYKDCAGGEAVKMSPPALTEAVERFLANKNAGNYRALVPMIRKFSSGYEDAYGVKPGVRAGQLCADKLKAT